VTGVQTCALPIWDCIRYDGKVVDLAGELWHELQKAQFDKYAAVKSKSVKELEDYDPCCRVLETIAKLKCISPCRLGGTDVDHLARLKNVSKPKGCRGVGNAIKWKNVPSLNFSNPFMETTPAKT
jgi:hypothetical protein